MENAKILALDVDDVLVHIATPWVARALDDPELGSLLQTLPRDAQALHEAVLRRPASHIQPWLVSQGFPAGLVPILDSLYRDDDKFYDALPPTPLFRGVLEAMRLGGAVGHVHVVTHCFSLSDAATRSKRRWLEARFAEADPAWQRRVTIHELPAGEKKSAVLARACPEPHTFADDSVSNVVDVLLNDAVRPHEILIPRMAHNDNLPPQARELAVLRRIKITYYENVA